MQTIFSHQAPAEQWKAILAFTQNCIQFSGPYSNQFTFAKAAFSTLQYQRISLEAALRLAISVFDYSVLDEMARKHQQRNSWSDPASTYYRTDAYRGWLPDQIIEQAENILNTHIERITISYPPFLAERFDNRGILCRLTPEFGLWVNSPDYLLPVSFAPRQELFRSLLQCGVNPLEKLSKPTSQESIPILQEPEYLKRYRRKAQVRIHASEGQLEAYERRTAVKWGQLLRESSTDTSDTILFNCGTAANEAVIHAFATQSPESVYVHPYWYFENWWTIFRIFDQKWSHYDFANADVACLCLDPTNYANLTLPNGDIPPLVVLEHFYRKAKRDPKKTYYVVLDVTVEPTFAVKTFIGSEIPRNLKIIKTLSASKHQRGGRHYFFGVAYVVGNDKSRHVLHKLVQSYRASVAGELSEPHKVFFPRPIRSQIEESIRYIRGLNFSIASLATTSSWRIFPYTIHSLILPPPYILEGLREIILRQPADQVSIIVEEINQSLINCVKSSLDQVECDDIEFGDSFGFPQTRVNVQGGSSYLDGVIVPLKIIRISPGYEANVSSLKDLIADLTLRLKLEVEPQIEEIVQSFRMRGSIRVRNS